MIDINLLNNLTLAIKCSDINIADQIENRFSFLTPGYQYSPSFHMHAWDGFTRFYNKSKFVDTFDKLPIGLFFDLFKFLKVNYKDIDLNIHKDVLNLFKSTFTNIDYDSMKYKARPYQKNAIEKALKHSKCILRMATGSGKSLVIAYIIKNIIETLNYNNLIIVPNLNLIEQFYADLIDYGYSESIIGKVNGSCKQYDKKIVISTWQSLQNDRDKVKTYETVIIDECHLCDNKELTNILKKSSNSIFRIGLTGTLPKDELELFKIKRYLGPILSNISAKSLIDENYISNVTIHKIFINYKNKMSKKTSFHEAKELVFNFDFRLRYLINLVNTLDSSVMILVGLKDKEGKILLNKFSEFCPKKEIIFLSGNDKAAVREKWRLECNNRNDLVIIATYPIFQAGVNIPSLKYLIFGAPFKSEIRILQSIGRTLRKHDTKINGAHVYDIIDNTKYFKDQFKIRNTYYEMEEFDFVEEILNE